MNEGDIFALLGLLLVGIVPAVYILPTLVAKSREHRNARAIGVLNVCLGWTLIGWVAALVWACTDHVREPG